MKVFETVIVATLSLGAWAMAYLGLPVPSGLEALHLGSAAAMAGGYLVGKDFMSLALPPLPRIVIIGVAVLVCSLSSIGYLVVIEKMAPSVSMAFVLAIGVIFIFFPIAFIIGSVGVEGQKGR